MDKYCENVQKLENFLEDENLEVTERIEFIKTLIDVVIGDSIIETTTDALDLFNKFIIDDFRFVTTLLNQNYPRFLFGIENYKVGAETSNIDDSIIIPTFITNLQLTMCNELTS